MCLAGCSLRPVVCLAMLLLLAACQRTSLFDDEGPAGAAMHLAALRAHYGQASEMLAELHVQLRPHEGRRVSFHLDLWTQVDGALRLRSYEKGVPLLDGLLAARGDLLLLLQRERVVLVDQLAALDGLNHPLAGLLRHLPLLADEIRAGPPGRDGRARVGAAPTEMMIELDDGPTTVLRLDDELSWIEGRTIHLDEGRLAHLRYARPMRRGGLLRAQRIDLQLDGLEADLVIRMVDWRPDRSGGPAGPRPPKDWPRLSVAAWIDSQDEDSGEGSP